MKGKNRKDKEELKERTNEFCTLHSICSEIRIGSIPQCVRGDRKWQKY